MHVMTIILLIVGIILMMLWLYVQSRPCMHFYVIPLKSGDKKEFEVCVKCRQVRIDDEWTGSSIEEFLGTAQQLYEEHHKANRELQ